MARKPPLTPRRGMLAVYASIYLPPESPVEGLLGLNVLEHFTPFQTFSKTLSPFVA